MDTLPAMSHPISIMDAIYFRRSIRNYSAEKVSEDSVHMLLYAAIQAPTAMHEEPWAFAVIQDKKILDRLSADAKHTIWREAQTITGARQAKRAIAMISDPAFNIFYNAGTLIIIYGKPLGPFVAADCWLAAENLMLAAWGAGLGSCTIGFALSVLNSTEWKKELGIPEEMKAYAPILLGYPADPQTPSIRKPPEMLCWK